MAVDPKVTALLLGMPKGRPSGGGGEDEEVDVAKSRELDAARAILKAVKSNDPQALCDALRLHHEAYEGDPEEKAESEE